MSKPKNNDDEVLFYESHCEIHDVLGDDFKLADAITDEQIDACAELITQAGNDFFVDAEIDLRALEGLLSAPSQPLAPHSLLLTHIYNIKSLAKVLGFSLITEICVHFIATIHAQDLTAAKKAALLQKLCEALRLAFTKRIQDEGGNVGKELLKNLRKRLK